MPETFLILLAAGLMLGAAISRPADVALRWLRLLGILALAAGGLALFFYGWRGPASDLATPAYRARQFGLLVAMAIAILAQLGFVQSARPRAGRAFACLALVVGLLSGAGLLHEQMLPRGTAVAFPPKPLSMALQALSCLGAAAVMGLALAAMLLGHAYLTAAEMTQRPFARLNGALLAALLARGLLAAGLAILLQTVSPRPMLVSMHGLLIATRFAVGLAVPLAFAWMARDCIRRHANQSATGILYVAAALVFLGELIALHLVRETGMAW